MNVLVIGGTRGLGQAVVVAAHAAGHTLTVMARNAAGFVWPVSGLRMVAGDAGDEADVDRAVVGQDAVVWTVGAAPDSRDAQVFSRGTGHVLKAMRAHGVRRLVCVTSVAAGSNASRARLIPRGFAHPAFARAVSEDKARQEAQIRDSAADWVIVRPAAMTKAGPTGLYQALTEPVAGRAKRIPRADVADFIVENLEAPDYVHRTVFLTA